VSISPVQFISLVRDIIDTDPRVRERGADVVTDLVDSYTVSEVRVLGGLLAATAAAETCHDVLEAEMHALLELGSRGILTTADLVALREIDRDSLPASLVEYVTDLLET
jgi:hypothetical protein